MIAAKMIKMRRIERYETETQRQCERERVKEKGRVKKLNAK